MGRCRAGLSTTGTSFQSQKTWVLFSLWVVPAITKRWYVFIWVVGPILFNMVVPRSGSEYLEYANTRSNLALIQDDILPVSPLNIVGVEYGFHPQMANMKPYLMKANFVLSITLVP